MKVKIESRRNIVETMLRWLPSSWYETLVCRMGDKYPPCHNHDDGPLQSLDSKRCHLIWRLNHNRGSLCHLERFSKFTLRLEVNLFTIHTVSRQPCLTHVSFLFCYIGGAQDTNPTRFVF